jgi:hypothetical protein
MWFTYFNKAISMSSMKPLSEDHYFGRVFNFYLTNYYSTALTANYISTQHSEKVIFNNVSYN